MIYERVHTIKTKRLISKYSINSLQRSRYEFQRNLRNISTAVIPAATSCPHKKGAAKLLQRLSQQSRLPPTGNKRLVFIVTLPSTGISQKLVTFSTAPHPLPYPLRTGGRQGIYTPASAALPSQPLYQAAFEHVRGLHSSTT